jgi:hypothetical protein
MRNLLLSDLKLALRALLEKDGLSELRKSDTGKLYEKRLRTKKKAIEAIPEAALTTAPFAQELAAADADHDGLGAATHYLCLAIEVHPKLPASLKEAAKGIRGTFVPQLIVLRDAYADEAAAALDNRPELTRLKAELKSIAVPGPGTLYDWVKSFLAAGDTIDALLKKRAKVIATSENAGIAGPLRGSTVGLLGRFRESLRDELEDEDCTLPPNYDAALFSYIDKLSADRAAAAPAATSPEPPAEAPAPAAPAPAAPAPAAAPPEK